MKLFEFLNHTNAALNFPAISLEDILVYCDMAVSELNTTLHIDMPSFSSQLTTYKKQKLEDCTYVMLPNDPNIPEYSTIFVKTEPTTGTLDWFFYDSTQKRFYKYDNGTKNYEEVKNPVGVFNSGGSKEFYKPLILGANAMWDAYDSESCDDYELATYLPDDWVLLWLIPYVCFKYTVRDGGTAQTFADELTQGFQQLQNSYNVPGVVSLRTVAGKDAYRADVLEHIANLSCKIPVKAIYIDMKHTRNMLPEYGSMYDKGGFLND